MIYRIHERHFEFELDYQVQSERIELVEKKEQEQFFQCVDASDQ